MGKEYIMFATKQQMIEGKNSMCTESKHGKSKYSKMSIEEFV